MVFAKHLREAVVRGKITCSIRIWTSPHVKEGKRYRMGEGEIEVDSITLDRAFRHNSSIGARVGFPGRARSAQGG